MANYTAADVKRLRELTGSGMMDCKNALAETDGDFDKAVELLRIKGAKDVGKRAERTTAEGLVAARAASWSSSTARPTSSPRTPSSRSSPTRSSTAAAAAKPADLDALKAAAAGGQTADEARRGAVREDRREARAASRRRVRRPGRDLPAQAQCRPAARRRRPGRVPGRGRRRCEAARAAAMQVAALKAKYVTRDEVPAEIVETERRIAEETAKEEGKPEAALPKIVEGRVNGFFKDVVLLEQASVTDAKKSVKAGPRRGRRDRHRASRVSGSAS